MPAAAASGRRRSCGHEHDDATMKSIAAAVITCWNWKNVW